MSALAAFLIGLCFGLVGGLYLIALSLKRVADKIEKALSTGKEGQ